MKKFEVSENYNIFIGIRKVIISIQTYLDLKF